MKTTKFFEQLETKPINEGEGLGGGRDEDNPRWILQEIERDTNRIRYTQGWDKYMQRYIDNMRDYLNKLEKTFK